VGEQERSLLQRADAIGTGARALVEETIEEVDEAAVMDELDFGMEDLRQTMLERRLDLLDVRAALIEDREALYEERAEKLENAESRIAELEENLVSREMEIASVLRKLITGAADFGDDGDNLGVADTVTDTRAATHQVRETNSIGREALKVESGTAEARKDAEQAPEPAPAEESEPAVDAEAETTEQAAPSEPEEAPEAAEEPAADEEEEDSGVRFNLEANFGDESGHTFFSYDDDGEDDLPGLFVATNNLLKEDRAVRVALSLGEADVQLKGIVAWRREEADSEGPAGMGIEITWLGPGAPEALGNWLAENSPVTV
jgi:hypothetical protein